MPIKQVGPNKRVGWIFHANFLYILVGPKKQVGWRKKLDGQFDNQVGWKKCKNANLVGWKKVRKW